MEIVKVKEIEKEAKSVIESGCSKGYFVASGSEIFRNHSDSPYDLEKVEIIQDRNLDKLEDIHDCYTFWTAEGVQITKEETIRQIETRAFIHSRVVFLTVNTKQLDVTLNIAKERYGRGECKGVIQVLLELLPQA